MVRDDFISEKEITKIKISSWQLKFSEWMILILQKL